MRSARTRLRQTAATRYQYGKSVRAVEEGVTIAGAPCEAVNVGSLPGFLFRFFAGGESSRILNFGIRWSVRETFASIIGVLGAAGCGGFSGMNAALRSTLSAMRGGAAARTGVASQERCGEHSHAERTLPGGMFRLI